MVRRPQSQPSHVINYRILDAKQALPKRRVTVHASRDEIGQLVEEGYLVRRSLVSQPQIMRFRSAVAEVLAHREKDEPDSLDFCFGSPYLRYLIDKHKEFLSLFKLRSTLSIAQAVLGPQVRFEEVTARVTDLSTQSSSTPWHIHLRVVPEPLPPFFAYPHAIDCLLYLDRVEEDSGSLCVLPGSHRSTSDTYAADDFDTKADEQILTFNAGDCLVMHANLWHRALPSQRQSGLRRIVIFGYSPSWLSGEERGSSRPTTETLARFRHHHNSTVRELAGEFYWG